MPIIPPSGLRRLDEEEFARAAYCAMEVVFQVKLTSLTSAVSHYEEHLQRLLAHTCLNRIQWVNLGRKVVTFRTLNK